MKRIRSNGSDCIPQNGILPYAYLFDPENRSHHIRKAGYHLMTSSNWLFFYMKERQSLFSSTYEEQPGEGIVSVKKASSIWVVLCERNEDCVINYLWFCPLQYDHSSHLATPSSSLLPITPDAAAFSSSTAFSTA